MVSELQRLVDSLGSRLDRSISVGDRELRLLAYNPQAVDVDPARAQSILMRGASRKLVEYIYAHGAGTADDLFTVPPNPQVGLEVARIGVPVRYNETLLGFVWLLESDGPITGGQAADLRRTADMVALILHREYLLGELNRGRERELTRDLLADQVKVRTEAAETLIAENLFSPRPVAVLVVVLGRAGEVLSDQDRLALAAGVEFGRHRTQQRSLTLERPDHAIIVISQVDPADRQTTRSLGLAVRDRVLAEASHTGCWVGIGDVRGELSDAHLSYAQARRAADVARAVHMLGPVVHYRDLGVYSMLAEQPAERLVDSLHPGVSALFERRGADDDTLITTLETFFDNAGNVNLTAEQLRIHRTSLYHRLKRIEEITGLNLAVGDDRLTLHLGLKIARFIELH